MEHPILIGILAILGLSLLIPTISPLLVICFRKVYPLELLISARRHLILSIFVALVVLCVKLGVTTRLHGINVFFVVVSLICSVLLSKFSFNLKPNFIKFSVGPISLLVMFLLIPFVLLGLGTGATSPKIVEIGESMYCRQSFYGFVGSGGVKFEVFKQYPVVDKLIVQQSYPDSGEGGTSLSVNDQDLVDRCRK